MTKKIVLLSVSILIILAVVVWGVAASGSDAKSASNPHGQGSQAVGPFSPETTVPIQTSIQKQYDEAFKQGFSSSSSMTMMEKGAQVSLPSPAIPRGWSTLSTESTASAWVKDFTEGLLNIDFRTQTRSGLGSWLVENSAPDLMPGVISNFENKSLVVSILDPSIMGENAFIPDSATWSEYASSETTWKVRSVEMRTDPQWQSMVDAGWQPVDLHADVIDVTVVLTVQSQTGSETKGLTLTVQTGSGLWHHGYGSAIVGLIGGGK